MKYMIYDRDSFHMRERICGATKHSIILKDDNGGYIYCTNSLFNKIMQNPTLEFCVMTLPEHASRDRFGNERWFSDSRWIEAFVPTRF